MSCTTLHLAPSSFQQLNSAQYLVFTFLCLLSQKLVPDWVLCLLLPTSFTSVSWPWQLHRQLCWCPIFLTSQRISAEMPIFPLLPPPTLQRVRGNLFVKPYAHSHQWSVRLGNFITWKAKPSWHFWITLHEELHSWWFPSNILWTHLSRESKGNTFENEQNNISLACKTTVGFFLKWLSCFQTSHMPNARIGRMHHLILQSGICLVLLSRSVRSLDPIRH